MEAVRQTLIAIYVALAEAAGGEPVLKAANRSIREAIDAGAIDDPTARRMLESIATDDEADERPPLWNFLTHLQQAEAA